MVNIAAPANKVAAPASRNAVRSAESLRSGIGGSDYMRKSMEYNLKALSCVPDNLQALESVAAIVRAGAVIGVTCGQDVQRQLNILAYARAKIAADTELPKLRAELQKLKADLVKHKADKGFFAGGKVKSTEAAIQKTEADIALMKKRSSLK